MENEKLKRLLTSIGKTCFIEYYHDFKHCTNKQDLALKIYQENPNRKQDKNITRINAALQIFNNHAEKEALKLILDSKHPIITAKIKKTAQKLLDEETNRN